MHAMWIPDAAAVKESVILMADICCDVILILVSDLGSIEVGGLELAFGRDGRRLSARARGLGPLFN